MFVPYFSVDQALSTVQTSFHDLSKVKKMSQWTTILLSTWMRSTALSFHLQNWSWRLDALWLFFRTWMQHMRCAMGAEGSWLDVGLGCWRCSFWLGSMEGQRCSSLRLAIIQQKIKLHWHLSESNFLCSCALWWQLTSLKGSLWSMLNWILGHLCSLMGSSMLQCQGWDLGIISRQSEIMKR